MKLDVLALCSGYGGLELGLDLAGFDTNLVAYSEVDRYAASVMAHHWPDAPNLGDRTEICNPPKVDVVTAGFPCQPVSAAGLREGVNDVRWIIRDVVSVWRDTGAPVLILENVPGLLSANGGEAFGQVLEALAEVGATARWGCLRASDVGACHRRERWFCVVTQDPHLQPGIQRGESTSGQEEGRGPRPDVSGRGGAPSPDVHGLGLQGGPVSSRYVGNESEDGRGRFGRYSAAITRWEFMFGRPAPDPTVPGVRGNRRLSPLFVEWMIGLPHGHVTGVDGLAHGRMLKILGNGVVPQQAATAFRMLGVGTGAMVPVEPITPLLPTPLARDWRGKLGPGAQWHHLPDVVGEMGDREAEV